MAESKNSATVQRVRRAESLNILRAVAENVNQPSAAVSSETASQSAADAGDNAGGNAADGADENAEIEVNGEFNQTIQLGGNNVKTDVLFPTSVSFLVFPFPEHGFQ